MASLSVRRLAEDSTSGVVVDRLQREDLAVPGVAEQLKSLWIEHGLISFRGGDCSSGMHIELSRCFGELDRHPLKDAYAYDSDEITRISYSPADSTVYEIRGEARGGWLPWHSDLAYVDRINRGGILRPVELPAIGGETGFIDQISAYAALPDRLKKRIEGLHVVYQLDLDATHQRFGGEPDVKLLRLSKATVVANLTAKDRPRALHPMVYEQAETGRKVLNVSPWFAMGIHEMPGEDGDDLLSEVIHYSTSEDLAYYHHWESTDEMLLWDNWRMLHCAKGVPAHLSRTMERTTIAGDYALGRWEIPGTETPSGPVIMV